MAYLPDRLLPAVVLLAVSAVGCSLTPSVTPPGADEMLPDTYDAPEHPGGQTDGGLSAIRQDSVAVRWWTALGDPALTAAIDSVLVSSFDLRIAAARVIEVQNRYRITRAGQYPGLQAGVEGNRQNTPTNTGSAGSFSENIPNFPDRFDITTYSASLGFGWEVDFWGKARAASKAAISEFIATQADYDAARVGVIAETYAAYFEIRDLQVQVNLTAGHIDLLGERLTVTRDRYGRGLATSFELYRVQQSLDDAQSRLPALEAALFDAKSRLGVLLGTTAANVEALLETGADAGATSRTASDSISGKTSYTSAGTGPSAFRLPDILPAELIESRPDLRAARARLEAARQQVGVARAEQFPSFSLTATGGTQSSTLTDLVQTTQRFWMFGGSLTAPVFSAGARRAGARAAWARYEQAAASYEKAVLSAFSDASRSINRHTAEMHRLEATIGARINAEASYQSQLKRYRRGVGDYVGVLDARINLIQARLAESTARRSLALARLGVHRALGGGWVESEKRAAERMTLR